MNTTSPATPSIGNETPSAGLGAWFTGADGRPRQRRYLLAAVAGCALIWTAALSFVMFWPKVYTVEWSLIVPNSDPDARVDLKNVGEAYATSRSTYDSKSLDPRVNYREIILNDNVLDAASELAKVNPLRFGQPRIKLIDQSSVMELRITGSSPGEALNKALSLDKAFQDRLTTLREDEITQREQAVEKAIHKSQQKLKDAQRDLVQFKVGAQIVTEKQLDEMALVSTGLQRRHVELSQSLAHHRATVQSLSSQLGVPPRIAGWTLTLQGDAVFLEHFKQFATASALLSDYSHKWDDAHPKVREATGQRDSAMAALAVRSRAVLGEPVTTADLRRLAIVLHDRSRDALLRDMVNAGSAADGAAAELREIDRQQVRVAAQLPKLAGESAQLNELQRRVNFSEAVFTNAVGKTDVGHANIFTSYPMVQTLVAPRQPPRASSPRPPYVAAGAMVASLLLLVGLSLAWLRAKR